MKEKEKEKKARKKFDWRQGSFLGQMKTKTPVARPFLPKGKGKKSCIKITVCARAHAGIAGIAGRVGARQKGREWGKGKGRQGMQAGSM